MLVRLLKIKLLVAYPIKNNCKINNERECFQLRGLCVYDKYQNSGIGTKIISKIENIIIKKSKYIWMNAEQSAVKFYLKT